MKLGPSPMEFFLERVGECASGSAQTLTVGGKTFGQLRSSLVYSWWRSERCLYVGKSINGLVRILSNHHAIKEVLAEDDFVLFFCSASDSEVLERWLIYLLKPELNKTTETYGRGIAELSRDSWNCWAAKCGREADHRVLYPDGRFNWCCSIHVPAGADAQHV